MHVKILEGYFAVGTDVPAQIHKSWADNNKNDPTMLFVNRTIFTTMVELTEDYCILDVHISGRSCLEEAVSDLITFLDAGDCVEESDIEGWRDDWYSIEHPRIYRAPGATNFAEIHVDRMNSHKVSWYDEDDDDDDRLSIMDTFWNTNHTFRKYLEHKIGIFIGDDCVVVRDSDSPKLLNNLMELLENECNGPGGETDLRYIADALDIGGDEGWDLHCGHFDEFVRSLTWELGDHSK